MKRLKTTISASAVVVVIAISASVAVSANNATVPGAITTPTVSGSLTGLILTWIAPAGAGGSDITGYTVEINDSGSVSTASASGTTYNHTSATPGDIYEYRVRATNGVGDGPWSFKFGAVMPTYTAPHKITNITATGSTTAVALAWGEPDDGGQQISGYTVEYKQNDPDATASTVSVTENSWTHAGTTGVMYKYRVYATNVLGDGPWSDSVSGYVYPATATVPDGVGNITATPSSTSIDLTWPVPSNGGAPITSYTVEFDDDAGKAFTATVSEASWSHTNPSSDYEHTYRVRASNDLGDGPWSSNVTATLG